MPPQITCAYALPVKMGKHENHILHSIGLCYTHNAPVHCLPERKNCHLWRVWQRLTFAETVRYPINTVHWLLLQAWRRTTHVLHSDWHRDRWLTQSMWVTDSRMLCSLPRSCLVHTVDRFDSEGWFSSFQVIFLTVFCVFLVKKHAPFKWKDAISGFPVSPGSAQALVRCGG